MTLKEYIRNVSEFDKRYAETIETDLDTRELPLYAFTDNVFRGNLESIALGLGAANADIINGLDISTIQLFVGPTGSGAPLHYHGPALNFMAKGTKRWQLFPPSEARFSIKPAAGWNREYSGYNRTQTTMFGCTQRTGDVLFIPGTWSHATENLVFSTGIAVEFKNPIMVRNNNSGFSSVLCVVHL